MRHTARDGTRGIRKIDVLSHHAGGESGCARSQFGDGAPSGSVGRVVVVLPPLFPPCFFCVNRPITYCGTPPRHVVRRSRSSVENLSRIFIPKSFVPVLPHLTRGPISDPIRSDRYI